MDQSDLTGHYPMTRPKESRVDLEPRVDWISDDYDFGPLDPGYQDRDESAGVVAAMLNPVTETISNVWNSAWDELGQVGEACSNKLGEVYESISSRIAD